MKYPFKVGDIVKGKSDIYTFTDKRMLRAEVVSLPFHSGKMSITVLEHEDSDIEGESFVVNNSLRYFERVEKKKEFNSIDSIKQFMDEMQTNEIIIDGLKIIKI